MNPRTEPDPFLDQLGEDPALLDEKQLALADLQAQNARLNTELSRIQSELDRALDAIAEKDEETQELQRQVEELTARRADGVDMRPAAFQATSEVNKNDIARDAHHDMANKHGRSEPPSHTSTFHLDLFARDSGFQGMIKDLRTGETMTFSDQEMPVFLEFIQARRPARNEAEEAVEEAGFLVHGAPIDEKKRTEPETAVIEAPVLHELSVAGSPPVVLRARAIKVFPERVDTPRLSVGTGQPFRVQLEVDIDLASPTGPSSPVSCQASVYARRMGGNASILLGQTSAQAIDKNSITFELQTQGLPAGIYRLESILSADFRLDHRVLETITSFTEGGRLHVV
jgi:hypothetical protein